MLIGGIGGRSLPASGFRADRTPSAARIRSFSASAPIVPPGGVMTTSRAISLSSSRTFPGNVRELESEMARLVVMTPPGGTIGADALNDRIRAALGVRSARKPDAGSDLPPMPPMSILEMEKRLIRSVLQSTDGNRTKAAEVLGISREGLRTKMQRLGLSSSD